METYSASSLPSFTGRALHRGPGRPVCLPLSSKVGRGTAGMPAEWKAKSHNREKTRGTQGRGAKQDTRAAKTFTESRLGLRKGLEHLPGVPTFEMLHGGPGSEVTWKRKKGSAAPVLKGKEKGGQGWEGLPGCVTQGRGAGTRPVLFREEFSRVSLPRLRHWGLAATRGQGVISAS